MKKVCVVAALIMVIIAVFLLVEFSGRMSDEEIGEIIGTNKLETEYYEASFLIDTSDLSAVTTYAKYLFVGTVEEYVKSDYPDEDSVYTYYSIKVVENIKGELVQDENVELKKSGGLKKNQECFILCSGDVLPAVGHTYIFAATIFPKEESLYCFGPGTVAEIENTSDYKNDPVYKKYTEALKTISTNVPDKNWPMSKYDVNYGK